MKGKRYATAEHRGALAEAMETEQPITEKAAKALIETGLYRLYAYDERIGATRYLLEDMAENIGLPQWLHKYGGKAE